jgi:hypothetical protein
MEENKNAYEVLERKPDGDGHQEDLDVDGTRLTRDFKTEIRCFA